MSMWTSVNINTLGLVFDIMGAFLLFRFGFAHEDVFPETGEGINIFGNDPERAARIKLYKTLSRCGILLLILGFVLQAISNYIE